MQRRELLAVLTATLLPNISTFSYAQDQAEIEVLDELPPLPPDLQQYAGEQPAQYLDLNAVGTGRPSQRDINLAHDILINSPFDVAPVEVARYFNGVGQGKLGGELRQFAREWPRIANPAIFHFFSATSTKPEGDVTAWCAAFVNWCIMRSNAKSKDEIGQSPGTYSRSGLPFAAENFEKFATRSASSGSFRCWKSISNPEQGDIMVLANKNTQGLTSVCLGQGHVAFFVKRTSNVDFVEVVGGNQTQAGSGGAVTRANFYIGPNSRFMKFVSVKKQLA